MNAINKPLVPALVQDKHFQGNLHAYLTQFFNGAPPPEAMEIDSWRELQDYLAGFIAPTLPACAGRAEHRIYGFEKDHLPSLLLKHILF